MAHEFPEKLFVDWTGTTLYRSMTVGTDKEKPLEGYDQDTLAYLSLKNFRDMRDWEDALRFDISFGSNTINYYSHFNAYTLDGSREFIISHGFFNKFGTFAVNVYDPEQEEYQTYYL